ncbi:MAG: DNA-directed RNA polymerase subunit alpha [Deltaproteobacteria bacterium]|jgi:DNA-directed RNA polymerase subunit alpha|nr:DNA-directed RNA polymerase subunit alpha [Deltaproteobacteria bacterium]
MEEKSKEELIQPDSVKAEKVEPPQPNYGKFVCEPLERGFGLTLGNALRRVMLSSLQGAAVVSVKFEGAQHELTTLPDVSEDVSDIILNLKEVRFRLHGSGEKTVRLNAEGPMVVTAAAIQAEHAVEILNKDCHLATLSKNGKLSMSIKVAVGKGYVPAEKTPRPDEQAAKPDDSVIGLIPVDALFSPIRKVNFNVTNARKGQRTDYDKLTLEVWTDGSITPAEAVAASAKILSGQLSVFSRIDGDEAEAGGGDEAAPELRGVKDNSMYRTVDELELSVRSANCLKNADIYYIGELVQKTEKQMLDTKNFGRKSLGEIKEVLQGMDLSLGMKVDGFVRPTEPLLKK